LHRKETAVIHSRTTILMNRMPRWFIEQAHAVEALAVMFQEVVHPSPV